MTGHIPRLLSAPERSFFLFGPRATGKSTWLQDVFPEARRLDLLDSADLFQNDGHTSPFGVHFAPKMAALKSGSQIGPYEILSPLGAGGMGEVYRSRDTKLKREVAIKVLPAEFSSDSDRIHRFQREAEVLATLNHPHIAQIYGLEESGGSLCLVLELVEGETLAERIKRGPIPLDEALDIARQIAEACEAAHERDIVHRDLKPANIKLTPDGKVKVLDFGLAKAIIAEASDAAMSHSPTLVSGTIPGMILGTAQYMSPEQAKGRAADARSDIWAFGCVLFEMLTGKPTFAGDSVVEILGGILRADPDWTQFPQEIPPAIRSLLKRCLQRDRNRRLRDIADARFQIEEALAQPAAPDVTSLVTKRRERYLWMATLLIILLAATINEWYRRTIRPEAPELRLQVLPPPGTPDPYDTFAISPDGQKLVFAARGRLWLRLLDSETIQPLPKTEGAYHPFWSPDSTSIAFFSSDELRRIDTAGEVVQTLASSPSGFRGGSWSASGEILVGPGNGPLLRVPAKGGAISEATRLGAKQINHRFPSFLPDGRRFVFLAVGLQENQGIYAASLDSPEITKIFDADSAAFFAGPDYLLFARKELLLAQRVDLKTLVLIGGAIPVAGKVAVNPAQVGFVSLSASPSGVIAYQSGAQKRQLIWFSRSGQRLDAIGEPDAAQQQQIRISPDGRTVALMRAVNNAANVYLLDVDRGSLSRFTSGTSDIDAVWSPDGKRIVYAAASKEGWDLYEKTVDGASQKVLLETPDFEFSTDWSSDGRFILYSRRNIKTGTSLWALPLFGDRKPILVAEVATQETGRFSPNVRWVAYTVEAGSRSEVYIQPFQGSGGRMLISTNGGRNPEWGADGQELFYIGPDDRLMAVKLQFNGSKIDIGKPTPLFVIAGEYTVARDGRRFLVNMPTDEISPVTVLLNWKPPSN